MKKSFVVFEAVANVEGAAPQVVSRPMSVVEVARGFANTDAALFFARVAEVGEVWHTEGKAVVRVA